MWQTTHTFKFKAQVLVVHDAPLRKLRAVYAAVTGCMYAKDAGFDPNDTVSQALGFDVPAAAMSALVQWAYTNDVEPLRAGALGWTRDQWLLLADYWGAPALIAALKARVGAWKVDVLERTRLRNDETLRMARVKEASHEAYFAQRNLTEDRQRRHDCLMSLWQVPVVFVFLLVCGCFLLAIVRIQYTGRIASADAMRPMMRIVLRNCSADVLAAWDAYDAVLFPPVDRGKPLPPFIELVAHFLKASGDIVEDGVCALVEGLAPMGETLWDKLTFLFVWH